MNLSICVKPVGPVRPARPVGALICTYLCVFCTYWFGANAKKNWKVSMRLKGICIWWSIWQRFADFISFFAVKYNWEIHYYIWGCLCVCLWKGHAFVRMMRCARGTCRSSCLKLIPLLSFLNEKKQSKPLNDGQFNFITFNETSKQAKQNRNVRFNRSTVLQQLFAGYVLHASAHISSQFSIGLLHLLRIGFV